MDTDQPSSQTATPPTTPLRVNLRLHAEVLVPFQLYGEGASYVRETLDGSSWARLLKPDTEANKAQAASFLRDRTDLSKHLSLLGLDLQKYEILPANFQAGSREVDVTLLPLTEEPSMVSLVSVFDKLDKLQFTMDKAAQEQRDARIVEGCKVAFYGLLVLAGRDYFSEKNSLHPLQFVNRFEVDGRPWYSFDTLIQDQIDEIEKLEVAGNGTSENTTEDDPRALSSVLGKQQAYRYAASVRATGRGALEAARTLRQREDLEAIRRRRNSWAHPCPLRTDIEEILDSTRGVRREDTVQALKLLEGSTSWSP